MSEIGDLLAFQTLSPERRTFALERIAEVAGARADAQWLLPHLERATVRAQAAVESAQDWNNQPRDDGRLHRQGARGARAKVVRTTTAIFRRLESAAELLDEEPGALAASLLDALSAHRSGTVIRVPYTVLHTRTLVFVAALGAGEQRAAVERLGLTDLAERLAQVNAAFGALLSEEDEGRIDFTAVEAADRASASAYASVLARIVGAFPTDEPADVEARDALLLPVWLQEEDARRARARRRRRAAAKGREE